MRRLLLLLATCAAALILVAQAGANPTKPSALNQKILDFCKKSMGKQVGDGQCADLAYKAMLAAGAESPDDFKDDPKPGDYVWGQFVYGHRIEDGQHMERGDRGSVQAGDIIQMRDVLIEHTEETDDYITKETIDADHHTAIVADVSPDGLTYDVIEQNSNEVPLVTSGKIHLDDMKRGYILVYRAIQDPDTSDDDPNGGAQLQGLAATRDRHVHRAVRAHRSSKPHRTRNSHRPRKAKSGKR